MRRALESHPLSSPTPMSSFSGAADHGGLLRLRGLQQHQPPVQWRLVLPAHEDPHHAGGCHPPAGVFQGAAAWLYALLLFI